MARNREMDNLAKDAAAALAAGMSYGRYMALRYKPPVRERPSTKKDTSKKEVPKGARVCVICGEVFYTKMPHQLCCSKECSKENGRRKSREYQRIKYAERKAKNAECK